MPIISRFYGMTIEMFFAQREHNPPHFHATYGDFSGEFDIRTLGMLRGNLPRNAQELVRRWASEHQAELMRIWETQEFVKIPPLE